MNLLNKALVIGATGGVGELLTRQLVRNYPKATISGTYRNSQDRVKISAMGATPVELDLIKVSELELQEMTQGMDAVFFTAGSGGKNVEDVDRDGAIKVAKALTPSETHLVVLSSIGVDQAEVMGELREYGEAKFRADETIREMEKLHLKATIVRPGALTDDGESGRILVMTSRDVPEESLISKLDQSQVVNSRADVARVLLECANVFGKDQQTRVFEMVASPLKGVPVDGAMDIPQALEQLV